MMRASDFRYFLSVLIGVAFCSAGGYTPARADDAATLRQINALTAQKNWSAALQVAGRGSTLAGDYYEWLNLQREDVAQDFDRYDTFLRVHGDWPGTRRIRANAERVMPNALASMRGISFFQKAPPLTARGMILYVRAREKSEIPPERAVLASEVSDWFITTTLGDAEQGLILAALGSFLTFDAMHARLDRLMARGSSTQARILARVMGVGYPELVEARLAVSALDKNAEAKLARVPKNLRTDLGLIADRMEWRRRKTDDASGMLELFQALPAHVKPNESRGLWTEQQALIYRLMKEQNYAEAYQVAARPLHDDKFVRGQAEWMAGHVAITYLNQPGRAFRHFEALYKMSISPLSRARAAYWAAEASQKLKYPDVARAWYRTASAYRGNFYGQLAATKLGGPAGAYRQGPPIATSADRAVFEQWELPHMARLMRRAGDTVRAEQFINRMAEIHAGQGGMMRLIVDLATELKLTSLAIKISRMAATDGVDFADYVYPTLEGVGTDGVEPALVYAVIRQESGFDVEAVSSAGARGLMQLMPATAKAVARMEREHHQNAWLTARPSHNIRLGSAYLKQLNEQYKSYALVAAAYNAGPGRVNEWLRTFGDPRTGQIALVDWIERIPIYETRTYVQRVLEGTAVYRQKLKMPLPDNPDPLHLGTQGVNTGIRGG